MKDNSKLKNIAVLGLSFKPGTSDVRMSPAISLINKLIPLKTKLRVFDPKAMGEAKREITNKGVVFSASADDALQNADIIILATQWPEFEKLNFATIRKPKQVQVFIDTRNQFKRKKLEALGFKYRGIGR